MPLCKQLGHINPNIMMAFFQVNIISALTKAVSLARLARDKLMHKNVLDIKTFDTLTISFIMLGGSIVLNWVMVTDNHSYKETRILHLYFERNDSHVILLFT